MKKHNFAPFEVPILSEEAYEWTVQDDHPDLGAFSVEGNLALLCSLQDAKKKPPIKPKPPKQEPPCAWEDKVDRYLGQGHWVPRRSDPRTPAAGHEFFLALHGTVTKHFPSASVIRQFKNGVRSALVVHKDDTQFVFEDGTRSKVALVTLTYEDYKDPAVAGELTAQKLIAMIESVTRSVTEPTVAAPETFVSP